MEGKFEIYISSREIEEFINYRIDMARLEDRVRDKERTINRVINMCADSTEYYFSREDIANALCVDVEVLRHDNALQD